MRVLAAMVAAMMVLGASPASADPVGLYPTSQTASVTEGATDTVIEFVAVTPVYNKPLFPDVQYDPAKLALGSPLQ